MVSIFWKFSLKNDFFCSTLSNNSFPSLLLRWPSWRNLIVCIICLVLIYEWWIVWRSYISCIQLGNFFLVCIRLRLLSLVILLRRRNGFIELDLDRSDLVFQLLNLKLNSYQRKFFIILCKLAIKIVVLNIIKNSNPLSQLFFK